MSSSSNKTTVVSHGTVTTAGTSGGSRPGLPTDEQEARLRQRLQAEIGDAFELLELLGRGGMGIVFRAREIALDREVALKVLTLDPVLNPEAFTRFEREARLAARLDHPHIVPIFTVGSRDSIAWYTMRLVRGGSVEDLLGTGEPLPFERALRVLRDVAAALDYAHRSGVVHRDIKPANILLGEGGHAMVADFGIAKGLGPDGGATTNVTGTGVIGSPAYMSPEQWRGDLVDGRADQYALAVVAYEMLVGRRPFESPRVQDLLKMHMSADVPDASLERPELDPVVGAAIRRAMAKYSSERFGTATAFVEALAGARPVARPRPVAAPPARPVRKRRPRVVLSLFLVTALTVGFGLAIPDTRPRTLAMLEEVERQARAQTVFVTAEASRWLGLRPPAAAALPDESPTADSAPVLAMAADTTTTDAALGAPPAPDSTRAPESPVVQRAPLVVPLAPDTAAGFRHVQHEEFGVVHVITRGGSARVRVDGRPHGFSPQLLRVAPGRHHVTVEGAGDIFLPTQVIVTVASGDTALAEFATPAPRVPSTPVRSAPPASPASPTSSASAAATASAAPADSAAKPAARDGAPPAAPRDSTQPPRR